MVREHGCAAAAPTAITVGSFSPVVFGFTCLRRYSHRHRASFYPACHCR